jgi:hypothetical protein
MRLHNRLRFFAGAATVAAVTVAGAHASAIRVGRGLPRDDHHVAPAVSHAPSDANWQLVAIAGGGTIALLGPALTSRYRRRGPSPASQRDVAARRFT